jgi:hypothetical protein
MADELPPAELSIVGSKDGRGRVIADLMVCTIRGNYRAHVTTRFGVTDLVDAVEGAKEFARILFEETATEYLSAVPDAGPHPDDTVVRISLVSEVTGEHHEFEYLIPEESRPNAHADGRVFYRF